VHREELVVEFGREEVVVRSDELRAQEQRHHPADEEEDEARDDEAAPDNAVVDSADRAPFGRLRPDALELLLGLATDVGAAGWRSVGGDVGYFRLSR
jgi:hypothetical protein